MAEMTPFERVATALNHEEPDRVPVALGGGPYGMVDALYFELLDYLDLGEPVAPFRTGHNISYIDDRVLARLGTDTRYVWPGASPSSANRPTEEDNVYLDGYGQRWRQSFPYYYPLEGILAEATHIQEIDQIVQWPDPAAPAWTAGVRARARHLKEETDYYVIARMVTSHGPYQTAAHLRGTEHFLLDMAVNPEFAEALVQKVTAAIDGLLRGYLAAAGPYIDLVELPGDDYAAQDNLIMSPQMFRRFFKPALARLVQTAKAYRPELKVMAHSDGYIAPLLEDFVEIGVDVVHPLEPVAGMDQQTIRQAFAGRLAFLGGVDIVHALPGEREEVEAEVRRRITRLAPGGGYVLAPSNHLQQDVPPENVVALVEAARRYGQYG